MLDVRDISFGYGDEDVVSGIGFSADEGEVVAVLGPNGVGKTTLLKCIDMIQRPRSGSVVLDGESVLDMKRGEVAKAVGYVPQRAHVSGSTVFESVMIGRKPHITLDANESDVRLVGRILEAVGLSDLSEKPVNEISGGEYQLVQIARALAQHPKLLLLDEPTSSLDLRNQYMILDTLSRIVKANGMCAVMSIHDLNQAIRFSDRFVFIKDGKVFASGGPEVMTPDNIRSVYGIDVMVADVGGRKVVVPLEVGHERGT